MKQTIINAINEKKLIAIIRGVYGEDCINLARALHRGGIDLIEVTFDQANPELWKKTQEAISQINEVFEGEVFAGAGTVVSTELVDLAYAANAKYIISPDADERVIQRTNALGLVSIPGALTPTEIKAAYKAGADFIKVFPTSVLGAAYIKAIRGPLNHIPLLAVGGVNEKNISEFLKAGVVGAGVGGNLVNKKLVAEGAFDQITALAQAYVAATKV